MKLSENIPRVAVIIPTKNRKDLLRQVLGSVRQQTVPCSIWVMDDGSTDGTSEMVRNEFPEAKVLREEISRGPVFQRNKGARLSTEEYLLTLDDDCELVSPATVAQTIASFDDPRVGAVTVPFVNIYKGSAIMTRAPSGPGIWVCIEYYGGMVMFSRSAYEQVKGYREWYFIQGEEGDMSIRLLAQGRVVRLGTADPLNHHESPIRNPGMRDWIGPRNTILFCWLNIPMPVLLWQVLFTSMNNLKSGVLGQRLGSVLVGLWSGVVLAAKCRRERSPVSYKTYRLSRWIRQREAVSLIQIIARLPPSATRENT